MRIPTPSGIRSIGFVRPHRELEEEIIARVDRDRAALGAGWITDVRDLLARGKAFLDQRFMLDDGRTPGDGKDPSAELARLEREFHEVYERVMDQSIWGP